MKRIGARSEAKKRVVVVDDSKTMQAVLEQIFSLRLNLDVVGLASDADSAASLIRSLKPDLVTIDLCMPYIDGGKLLEMISDVTDVRKVVISSQACDSLAMMTRLEKLGADACIDKKDMARDPAKFCGKILAVLSKPSSSNKLRDIDIGANKLRNFPSDNGLPNIIPIPFDEQERLAVLARTGLANSQIDHQLDLLTEHMGNTTEFPTCLMTFIDRDTQWIKSSYGFARGSMPRAIAFCNYTLCADDTFIVSNASVDPRFCYNPLVTGEPRIRTYVGHPIISSEGVKLGAICLIDNKPRIIKPDVVTNLRGIARIAAEMINLRLQSSMLAA